jgi:hypothetical protein
MEQSYEHKDITMLENGTVAIISKLANGKAILRFFSPNKRESDWKVEIKELAIVEFIYPILVAVKGTTEILIYSISEKL